MILKLDHIAYTCTKEFMKKVIDKYKGYHINFLESDISNVFVKRKLMAVWQKDHDIALIEKDGEIPIEVTAYDKTAGYADKYEIIEDNIIRVNTGNYEESQNFYNAIGFREDGHERWRIKPVMGFSPVSITFDTYITDKRKYENSKLDSEGFCCLAFITNNIIKEKSRLDAKGIDTTNIENILLHGRRMDIFFAFTNQGDICEFIGMKQQSKGD